MACLCGSFLINSITEVDVCFFFFSSRRRHTRLVSDWSSDVCSSDLDPGHGQAGALEQLRHVNERVLVRIEGRQVETDDERLGRVRARKDAIIFARRGVGRERLKSDFFNRDGEIPRGVIDHELFAQSSRHPHRLASHLAGLNVLWCHSWFLCRSGGMPKRDRKKSVTTKKGISTRLREARLACVSPQVRLPPLLSHESK